MLSVTVALAISLYIGNGGQITVSEESQEEGMDWNPGMTSGIPTSTEQEAKKDTDDISGWFTSSCAVFIDLSIGS